MVTIALILGIGSGCDEHPLRGGGYSAAATTGGMSAAFFFSMSFRFPSVPAVCVAATLLASAVSTHAEDAAALRELEALRRNSAPLEELVGLPAEAKEVTVPESGEVRMDFVLTVKGLPKI